MLSKYVITLAIIFIVAQASTFAENTSDFSFVKSPPFSKCQVGGSIDLGFWDDASAFQDSDIMVLRRGEDLFSLSLSDDSQPKKLSTAADINASKIINTAECGKRLWLFCQANELHLLSPFAVDAASGLKVDFAIPGISPAPTLGAQIDCCVISTHNNGALLEISNGVPETWPREGGRPIYFWLDLKTGKVRQLPTGYDVEFFSADQSVFVYYKHQVQPNDNPYSAMSMETGKDISEIPDKHKDYWIEFASSDKNLIKPPEPEVSHTGDNTYFAGISANGIPYYFNLPANEKDRPYFSASVTDGWAEVRLYSSFPSINPSLRYIRRLTKNGNYLLLGEKVNDCALIGPGAGIFIQFGHGSKGTTDEAFFFDAKTKRAWNVLEGIQTLPELSPEDAKKDYIEDGMKVILVRGNSKPGSRKLVLCLYAQFQGDVRTCGPELNATGGREVEMQNWHHAVLVAADGRRYDVGNLKVDPFQPKWLHNSGKLIISEVEKQEDAAGWRLRMIDFGIKNK